MIDATERLLQYIDEDKEKKAESAREQLKRFLHYCNRYMNHNQSLRFEAKLYGIVEQKMHRNLSRFFPEVN